MCLLIPAVRGESLAELDTYSVEDIHFIDHLELQLGSSGSLGLITTRFGIRFGTIRCSSQVLRLYEFQEELLEMFKCHRMRGMSSRSNLHGHGCLYHLNKLVDII